LTHGSIYKLIKYYSAKIKKKLLTAIQQLTTFFELFSGIFFSRLLSGFFQDKFRYKKLPGK